MLLCHSEIGVDVELMALLNVAPGIQEAVLFGELAVTERRLRALTPETCWAAQNRLAPRINR